MPTYLKPSYPNLDAIPEAQRDFYVLNTTSNVYELAQQDDEIGKYFNRDLARKRDEFRDEKDRLKRESERQGREITRLTESNQRLHDTRERDVTRLTEQLTKAEEDLRKATTGDGVVITKEEKALFDRLTKLGKPEDVTANKLDAIVKHVETVVAEADTLRTENAQHKLDEVLREAADFNDWNFAALRDVIRHPDYGKEIEIVVEGVKDKDRDNEIVRTPFVKFKKDGKDEKVALDDYAGEHWQTFLPALTAESSNGGERETGTKLPRQKPSTQRSGNEGKPGTVKLDDKIKSFNEDRNRAPNPLSPQPAQPAAK